MRSSLVGESHGQRMKSVDRSLGPPRGRRRSET
jgi:hypothetical protein